VASGKEMSSCAVTHWGLLAKEKGAVETMWLWILTERRRSKSCFHGSLVFHRLLIPKNFSFFALT
jgi:hypothetical protein